MDALFFACCIGNLKNIKQWLGPRLARSRRRPPGSVRGWSPSLTGTSSAHSPWWAWMLRFVELGFGRAPAPRSPAVFSAPTRATPALLVFRWAVCVWYQCACVSDSNSHAALRAGWSGSQVQGAVFSIILGVAEEFWRTPGRVRASLSSNSEAKSVQTTKCCFLQSRV